MYKDTRKYDEIQRTVAYIQRRDAQINQGIKVVGKHGFKVIVVFVCWR